MSRRRGPSARVCIFADLRDLPAVERLLADLPGDVYGQLYIASEFEFGQLPGPERIQAMWIAPGFTQGCVLSGALASWSAEWLTDEALATGDLPLVWVFPWAAAALAKTGAECVTRMVTQLPSTHLAEGYDGTLPAQLTEVAASRPLA